MQAARPVSNHWTARDTVRIVGQRGESGGLGHRVFPEQSVQCFENEALLFRRERSNPFKSLFELGCRASFSFGRLKAEQFFFTGIEGLGQGRNPFQWSSAKTALVVGVCCLGDAKTFGDLNLCQALALSKPSQSPGEVVGEVFVHQKNRLNGAHYIRVFEKRVILGFTKLLRVILLRVINLPTSNLTPAQRKRAGNLSDQSSVTSPN